MILSCKVSWLNGRNFICYRSLSVPLHLYLELAESTKLHAGFHFSLLPGGKLTDEPHGGASYSAVFKGKEDPSWGFKNFVAHADLEKGYLKDDSVFIRCDITVLNKSPVRERQDIDKLQLLCDCKDDLCTNIHRGDAAASSKRSCHKLKKMLLGCLPI
ncbi:hypothetical protein QOZ80_7BG0612080 [Eleusine coracana subsp. coracana]|nr:hypothetical protein QOZ80_7BG0612080 [Eleusine coracana subsp. coracana]